MTHKYTPASDTTLAVFRKDIASGEQLETIRISRVVLGEIITRLDRAESDRAALREIVGPVTALSEKYRAHGEVFWPGSVIAEQLDYWLDERAASKCCAGCSEPNRCGCPPGAVWVQPINESTKPPYGTAERAAYDGAHDD